MTRRARIAAGVAMLAAALALIPIARSVPDAWPFWARLTVAIGCGLTSVAIATRGGTIARRALREAK